MEGTQRRNYSVQKPLLSLRSAVLNAVFYSAALSTVLLFSACATTDQQLQSSQIETGRDANRLYVVDCLLPGQLRRLGRSMSFVTPRRPVKVSVSECEIRGGEYVAYDRSNFATSLKIWLPKAQSGDAEAQTYVGEIFEKGLGQTADAEVAAGWYLKAAEQGFSRAKINLGYLYESGLGVTQDLAKAMNLYRQAAGFSDGSLEYITSIEVANRKQQAAAIPVLNAELDQANASLVREKQAFDSLQDDYLKLEQLAASIRTQLASASSGSLDQEADDSSSTEINSDATEQQVGRLLTDMEKIKSRLNTSQNAGMQLLTELEVQQKETASLRSELKSSNSELSQVQDELNKLVPQISQLEIKLASEKENQQSNERSNEQQLKEQLAQSVKLRDQLTAQANQLNTAMTAQSSQMIGQLRVAEAKEKSLTLDLGRAKQSAISLQQAFKAKDASYRQQLNSMNLTQAGLKSRLTEQQNDIVKLEKQLAEEQRLAAAKQSSEVVSNSSISALEAELVEKKNQLLLVGQSNSVNEQASIAELARLESILQAQQDIVADQRKKIGLLERSVSSAQAVQRGPDIEQVTLDPQAVGPTIEIINPPLSFNQGVFALPINSSSNTANVIGRVSPSDELLSFQIDGDEKPVNEHGVFKYPASLDTSSSITLTAVDVTGERVAMEIMLNRVDGASKGGLDELKPEVDVSQVDFGSYHALIIGNSQYQQMQAVQTAGNDATALAGLLKERFGFSTELLIDADRYDIMAALNRKRDELGQHDNLFVYFAGHGEFGDGKGYWLPIDADPNDKKTWISNVAVTGLVDSMSAKHVMLLADSIFSGTLSRASLIRVGASMAPNERLQAYEMASVAKARTVLSASLNDSLRTADEFGHSLFTSAVLDRLSNIRGNVIMAHDLFVQIRDQLESTETGRTLLEYAPLKFAGHENGEFMFVATDNRSAANQYHVK